MDDKHCTAKPECPCVTEVRKQEYKNGYSQGYVDAAEDLGIDLRSGEEQASGN